MAMTTAEIVDAINILGACYRQASLSNGSWRCYFWRQSQQVDAPWRAYPAPYNVDPAEYMAEKYHAARNTMHAVLVT